MDGTSEHLLKQIYPGSEDQKLHVLPHMDYRPKTNTVILLDIDHTLKGECTWEE
jgi:hypothetical protein